jgi:DoxX-like family
MTAIATPRTTTAPTTRFARTGTVISLLAGLFLLFDATIHILAIQPVVDSFRELGFVGSAALPLGLLELALLALYAIPRTSVLGAILLTGYLGGAVCAHFRVEDPMFSTTLFPVYLGIALWAGLYLRNAKLRALLTS